MSDNKENVDNVPTANVQVVPKDSLSDDLPKKQAEIVEAETPQKETTEFVLADKELLSSEALEMTKKIEALFREGKRFCIMKKFSEALKPLSECCEIIASTRGETHWSMAESGYWYGHALMFVSLASSDIFGSKLPAEEQQEDGSDGENNEERPALGSINEEHENSDQQGTSSDQPGPSSSAVNLVSEEVSDHELAYEWLELARSIFSKDDTKKSQLRVTNCLMDLVDLKMEDEKFESCKEDLKNAIEIQKVWLDPNDREISSSYYQLGMVEEMLQLPKEAINSYKEAHARLVILQSIAKDKFANASAEEVGKLKKDIADFKEIIPEVVARIEGCELSIKEYDEVKSTLKDMMKETLTGGSIPTTSSPGTSLNAAQPASVNTLTAKRKNNKRVATEAASEPSKKQREADE